MRKKLQEHIFGTYLDLRYGVAVIGALLPVVVYVVGAVHHVPLADSISAYYWVPDGIAAPARNWLVGSLFAIGACLYLYKGFSQAENFALNLAALLGLGVALIPTPWNCHPCPRLTPHGFCAIAMFLCLVYVVWFRSGDTLSLLADQPRVRARYRHLYAVIGGVMLASPLTAFVLSSLVGTRTSYVFFVESAGIWAFAAYWLVKSSELRRSAATARALRGEIAAAPRHGGKVMPATPPPHGEPPAMRG